MAATTEQQDVVRWRLEVRAASIGGVLTAVVAFVGLAGVGRVSSFEAIQMLEATQPTIRFLSAATLTGGVTVLALMLTLLSISASLEHEFTNAFYFRVRRVSSWNMVLIVLSMVMLMVLSVPLEESESLRRAYTWVYFGAVLLASLLGGILIAIVVMLNATVHSLVDVLRPGSQSSLIHSQRGTDEERDLDAV